MKSMSWKIRNVFMCLVAAAAAVIVVVVDDDKNKI